MNPTPLAALLLVLGCALARQAPRQAQRPEVPAPGGRRIWLSQGIPSLGLLGNRFYQIDPDALLYLGDPVAVRIGEDRVMLAPYQDELLAAVVGRVVA